MSESNQNHQGPLLPTGINLFRLDGRVALVTGAYGHLGKSMAYGLAEAGAQVIVNGRSPEKLALLASEMMGKGYKVTVASGDVTEEQDLKRVIELVTADYNCLDIIINNAYAGRTGTVATSSIGDFSQAYQITVTAAFRIVQLAQPLLEIAASRLPGGASVINIASMYGMVSPDPAIYGDSGSNSPPYYGAAKAGLIQLTRYLACHLASSKIRVNCISPGPFPPPEISQNQPAFYAELCRKNPMHRIGFSDELKGAVLFLASDAASYVTGVNLPVDGGWTAW